MRFAFSDRMQFAEGNSETGILPFRMLARSTAPIDHYYWGRIVHDMAGLIVRKDSITVDYTHDYDEVIGFANQFAVTDAGLEVSGSLVTTQANDRADEVYRKGRAGVPYEASIDWNGPEVELEYIPSDVTTEVNGMQFAGPGYVVRKWSLRAIAICRYGADPDTRTQFSKSESDTVSVSILTPRKETTIVAETSLVPAAAGGAPAAAGADTQQFAQPGHISIEMLKQFSTEFGPKGTEYLTAGLTLDAARYQFAVYQRDQKDVELKAAGEQLTAKDVVINDLKTKLQQFGEQALGQATPLDTTGTGGTGNWQTQVDDAKLKQFALAGGENRAKFAAGMKLRGT